MGIRFVNDWQKENPISRKQALITSKVLRQCTDPLHAECKRADSQGAKVR
jgi:hypothetical protein